MASQFDLRTFAKTPRVTDGAYGTELHRMGVTPPGTCLELLNLENPSAVEAVSAGYVRAGSDVIMTNSLSAHRFGLASHGLADRAGAIAEAAAEIARRAAKGSDVKVFGSFGPSGKLLMMGEVTEASLSEAFAETAVSLERGGAEAIVLETFSDLAEARVALRAVKAACRRPVIVSLAFAFGPDKTATMMGDTPASLAAMAEAEGADAIGANCGVGPDVAVHLAKALRAASDLPIWIKPNAGVPQLENGETVFPMGPEEFASFVPAIVEAGATLIGGCCGCGPQHIRAVRASLHRA
jgi:5-methyltetrahydrofolate--homocysteine methyltransferase